MTINNEYKLCRAFDRLLKSETLLNYVHCTRPKAKGYDACLPHRPCPGGDSILGPSGS